ncbi:phosphatidylglycerol---prolipoprotein diacylglyceryl transferase [Candidatus Hakubella thermalkaliphila]|uniref:Phosphatidylglycerol--prolipoprotein diacylglyceryl transferase n=1 Tax=Candidatus Hakubella thermalkaliphila TaxID=2754717 RepID=A0A6V8PXJ3_9ACTN|nr:prolipoprotein diacylglyceryl transferase family protein [Candidatus Hakubella thermalkaliphila]GFP37027.1 phosphatidylglycerol---prolipoprotein diacylglyceryl transferase [Candidatus Hakubella thermalkaliphila]GFP39022.1 phosphatidylglycerol---prolipoprotein diacylglyceryl transferase [Candidatus Hakubella thermalkaliphila]
MFYIGVDPNVRLASLAIPLYAIFIVSAILLGLFLALALARRYGFSHGQILAFFLAAVPGGLVGARLVHVIDKAELYLADPMLIPAFWLGGFSQYGMIIGGLATVAVYAHWRRLPLLRFLDLITVPLLAGLSLGRVGCIVQGCCYGTPTTLPWGFVYTHPASFLPADWIARRVPIHPAPLYEILWFLALLSILLALRAHLLPKGMPFLVFLVGHSAGRFIIMFFRADPVRPVFAGLDLVQVIALPILIFSIPLLLRYRRIKQLHPRIEKSESGRVASDKKSSPKGLDKGLEKGENKHRT